MPVFATFFMIITLSSIGLPALNGFIGEFTILVGAFHIPHGSVSGSRGSGISYIGGKFWVVASVVIGIVLGAAYMLWLYQRTMFGKLDNPENQKLKDLQLPRDHDAPAARRLLLLDRPLPGAVLRDSRPAGHRNRPAPRGAGGAGARLRRERIIIDG